MDRFRVLTHVLRHESAFSLGTAGRRLRAAVEALERFDAADPPRADTDRARLVRNAAHASSAVVIQREALGIRDHTALIKEYRIPPEVWRSMGVVDRTPS